MDLVIRALARLVDDVDGVHLKIVGQGPERANLHSLAVALGVERLVHFEGFVPRHADVLTMIGAARCLVSPSEIEGFGIVVVEAQAVGTPVVVSDIPAFRELIGDADGAAVGGALVPVGDDLALANALLPLLTDDVGWQSTSEAAILHSARYQWASIAAQTAESYGRALGTTWPAVTSGAFGDRPVAAAGRRIGRSDRGDRGGRSAACRCRPHLDRRA